MFKSGFVTIIGKPNVGKSTLMNAMIGEKIAITSYKPQTTRDKITSILTTDDYQMVFLDTPGIHKPKNKLGEYMMKEVKGAFKDIDVLLYLVEPKENSEIIKEHIEMFKNIDKPVILVINKTDSVKQDDLIAFIEKTKTYYDFKEVVPVSALKKKNVDTLKEVIASYLPEGPMYYDEEMITDKTEREIASEIIREKALLFIQDEIPHGIAVVIEQMKEMKDLTKISATLYCQRESHKGIIIGKGGAMLKKIGTRSRLELEKFRDQKAMLNLVVTYNPDIVITQIYDENPAIDFITELGLYTDKSNVIMDYMGTPFLSTKKVGENEEIQAELESQSNGPERTIIQEILLPNILKCKQVIIRRKEIKLGAEDIVYKIDFTIQDFLLFLGQLDMVVDDHLAHADLLSLDVIFVVVMYGHTIDFLVCEAVHSGFLHFGEDVAYATVKAF